MSKDPFKLLRDKGTAGENFELTTDDIISRLEQWMEISSFEITDASEDSLSIKFSRLPEELEEFAEDIYDFCPDVVDQGFAAMDDFEDDDSEESEEMMELTEGLDPEDPDFGLKVLVKALERDKALDLWWD